MARRRQVAQQHFRIQYGNDHPYMPVWVATEIMTFGHVLKMYQGAPDSIKQNIAVPLGIHDRVLGSWLLSLNTVRNICAHHSRLWNRSLGTKPMIPKNDSDWHDPISVGNDRDLGVLTILKYCLDRIAPQSSWSERLFELLDSYSEIPLKSMGFHPAWRSCPIWSSKPSK